MYLDQARAVSQLGDADALPPMLTMLEESLERDIPLMDACIKGGDMIGANRLLHQLKGFTPVFCVDSLVELVVNVEHLSKHAESSDVRAAYKHLAPQLETLRSEVATYLSLHPAD